jgi:Contact-dependent growth inhibition CdiA C-terminal domain
VYKQLGSITLQEGVTAFGLGALIGAAATTEIGAAALGPVGGVLSIAYMSKKLAEFDPVTEGAAKATKRSDLDKPAQELGKWFGTLAKDGALAAIGGAGTGARAIGANAIKKMPSFKEAIKNRNQVKEAVKSQQEQVTPKTANERTQPSLSPDKTRVPEGKPKVLDSKNVVKENVSSNIRENESAKILAQNGYKIEQLADKTKGSVQRIKKPDFKIEEKTFDNYAPNTSNARSIHTVIKGKLDSTQADRFILNLNDSTVNIKNLVKQFNDYPIKNLKEIIIIKDEKIIRFFPFEK